MVNSKDDVIPVLVAGELPKEIKGFLFKSSDDDLFFAEMPMDKLKEGISSLCHAFVGLLEDVKAVGRFQLDEVTLQVEVSAEVGVALVGTSKAGGKGGITLKFKR